MEKLSKTQYILFLAHHAAGDVEYIYQHAYYDHVAHRTILYEDGEYYVVEVA